MGRKTMTGPTPETKGRRAKAIRHPRVMELRIRLLHEKDPDANGFWRFAPEFPNEGTADCRIVARDVRTAKGLLEAWLYNELSSEGLIEDEEAMQNG